MPKKKTSDARGAPVRHFTEKVPNTAKTAKFRIATMLRAIAGMLIPQGPQLAMTTAGAPIVGSSWSTKKAGSRAGQTTTPTAVLRRHSRGRPGTGHNTAASDKKSGNNLLNTHVGDLKRNPLQV
ncbi:hypothetical protein KC930_02790 [Candidatus Saccharibacteria bacterium]|nr:hypothetical protein [Candidatus Saccharibacteria bacterium]